MMKTKMKMLLTALSVAFLMVFSFNVFSQGNKPVQDDKSKKSGCMAMMQDEAQMKDCMAMMGKDMEKCMAMMDSKEMKAMCDKMMSGMQDGMKMDENKGKAPEPKSQKL